MGYQAKLSDNTLVQPLVDVLAKRLTPKQANDEFRGTTGTCPHCLKLIEANLYSDNATVQAAMSNIDLSVGFRCAHLVDDVMKRVMHFAHRPDPRLKSLLCRICADDKLAYHAAVLDVISAWAVQQWSDCWNQSELQIHLPGAPPETFRPDICGYRHDTNAPVYCIEYQRTYESFEKFKRRHEIRHREFPQVLWYFEASVYARAREHRRFLSDRNEEYRKCWVEPSTGQLIGEIGVPPKRKIVTASKGDLNDCSLDRAINDMEAPRLRKEQLGYREPLNTSMPFRAIGEHRRQQRSMEECIQDALDRGYTSPSLVHSFLRGSGLVVPIADVKKALRPAVRQTLAVADVDQLGLF